MVAGEYHRCGFGVESGLPSRCWTSMTFRAEFGELASMVFMYES
jgi:hypothetical protein